MACSRLPGRDDHTVGWGAGSLQRAQDAATGPGLESSSVANDVQEVRRGTIFTFGSNQYGQLGVGRPAMSSPGLVNLRVGMRTAPGDELPIQQGTDLWWSSWPVRVMALKESRVKDIACGESHCMAVDADGQLYAWGSDEWGQLGVMQRHAADLAHSASPDATAVAVAVAEKVAHLPVCVNPLRTPPGWISGTPHVQFAAVACGAQFSIALDRAGSIWAWGTGEGGVLGLGPSSVKGRSAPTRLDTAFAVSGACSAVACGSHHSMALLRDGELYAWGRAEGGQLGLSESRIAAHIREGNLDDTFVCDPLRVLFTRSIHKAANDCRMLDEPQIGDSESADLTVVSIPDWDDTVRVRNVACGDVHSCVLDLTGQVWSWGWGEFGQLGLGFSSATYELGIGGFSSKRATPERVDPQHFAPMQIRSVACGGAFSAAIAEVGAGVPENIGNLFLWGANEVGQCALQPKKPSEVEVPKKVGALSHVIVRSVACGVSHVVAVDIAGCAYSWGSSHYGQLGAFNPPRTFAPPPACEIRDPAGGSIAQYQPMMIQSVARLRIKKAACGLYHSLLVSEGASEVAQCGGRVRGVSMPGSPTPAAVAPPSPLQPAAGTATDHP
eukprot:NODE_3800_length_1983_cov_9.830819.p1 GENE.NODE_3800_length_1983_cov_9.830819~~NODE_3800_length_1983_cov_9.830819.p1  ORF type:complete len:641 (+),score=161.21 NODE_3800_length_1983_cov_9.830819:93-1925(+)